MALVLTTAVSPSDSTDLTSSDLLLVPDRHELGRGTESWVVSSEFVVEANRGAEGTENRIVRHGRPSLTIQIANASIRDQAASLRGAVRRAAMGRTMIGLLPDAVELTSAVTTGATILPVTATTLRRLETGSRVLIAGRNKDVVTAEIATLSAVATNQLTLTAGTALAWDVCDRVMPFLESHPIGSQAGLMTDEGMFVDGEAIIARNAAALSPLVTPGTNPSGFTILNNLPILRIPGVPTGEAVGFQAQFDGATATVGPEVVFSSYGTYAAEFYDTSILCRTRQLWYDLLRLYHSRGGDVYRFWFVHPGCSFRSVSRVNDTTLRVEHYGDAFDWLQVKAMMVVNDDGTETYGVVDSVTPSTSTDDVTFATSILAGKTPCRAFECIESRFDAPLEEQWLDRDSVQVSTSIRRSNNTASVVIEEPSSVLLVEGNVSCTPPYGPLQGVTLGTLNVGDSFSTTPWHLFTHFNADIGWDVSSNFGPAPKSGEFQTPNGQTFSWETILSLNGGDGSTPGWFTGSGPAGAIGDQALGGAPDEFFYESWFVGSVLFPNAHPAAVAAGIEGDTTAYTTLSPPPFGVIGDTDARVGVTNLGIIMPPWTVSEETWWISVTRLT